MIASSNNEATAGSNSHIKYFLADGATMSASAAALSAPGPWPLAPGPASAASPVPGPDFIAVTPHSTTNTPYAADHIQACWCVVNTGSKRKG